MKRQGPEFGFLKIRNRLWLGLVILNLVAAAWVLTSLVSSRRGVESRAITATKNMAVALDQNISRSVENIDLLLWTTQDYLEQQLRPGAKPDADAINRFLQRQQQRAPGMVKVRVCDATGRMVYGPDVDPARGLSWADRDFFATLKADPRAGLQVSNPLLSKVNQGWLVSFARRYNQADGRFAGVVSVSVPIDFFYQLLSTLDVGPHGAALLRDAQFGLISRYPRVDGPSGQLGSKGFSEELGQAMASGEQMATFHAKTTADGVERTSTYRRLTKVPFHLVAGLGAQDYLQPWYTEAINALAEWLLFVLVTSLATWFVWRAIQRSNVEYQRGRAILRGASDGIHILDAQGRLLQASDSFYEMLGYPLAPGELTHVGQWDAQFTAQELPGVIAGLLLGQSRQVFQTRHRRSDGSVFDVEVSVHALEIDGQKVLFNSSRDIGARIAAETRARQSYAVMVNAIDAVDEAFVLYDADDRLAYCNEKYRQLYTQISDLIVVGTRFEDTVRQAAERGLYLDALGQIDAFVAERVDAHQTGGVEVITHLQDGRVLRVIDRRMPDGQTVGFRMDITRLVKATQEARDAAQAKAHFLANMSHEIRTPMNAVLGMLRLMGSTPLTPVQYDYLHKTEGAAKSLLGLLNDILDYSKIDAGKMELERSPVVLESLLRDLAVLLAASLGSKPVDLVYDLDPELPAVLLGDGPRLLQVLVNLAGNAVKFTQKGQVVVGLRRHAAPEGQVAVEFWVADSGIGIAPDKQQKIFGSFSQAEASTTRRFGGTGLGLAISQRLVEMMGSAIALSSEEGVGSTFRFHLLLGSADPSQALPAVLPAETQPRRILLVDDNAAARNSLLRMLQAMGWTVDAAAGGAQALAQVQALAAATGPAGETEFPYSHVVMNWQMPDLDGWDTLQALRQRHPWAPGAGPHIVVVSDSGHATLAQRSTEDLQDIRGLLVKPVTPGMLVQACATAVPAALEAPHSSKVRRLAGKRILVVEDNAINQQVAEGLLSLEGAWVSIAADGLQGVKAITAARKPFDVVLMDVQMPVMDGFEATQHIRDTLGLHALPIIGLTANAMASDREACLQAGMTEHVGKPFDIGQLVALVLRLCGTASVAAPPASKDPDAPLPHALVNADIDVPAALLRMGGLQPLYVRMARELAADMPNWERQLQSAWDSADASVLALLLHSYKGNASALGLHRLAQTLAALEQRTATAVPSLQAPFVGLGAVLADAMAALQLAQSSLMDPQALEPGVQGEAAARSQLERLLPLLAQDDMESLALFADIRASLAPLPEAPLLRLETALQDLDLQQAHQACLELLA